MSELRSLQPKFVAFDRKTKVCKISKVCAIIDILNLTSARCAEVGILAAGGTWALRFPSPQKIKFVAVLKGNCWLTFKDESTLLQVKTGDVFVLRLKELTCWPVTRVKGVLHA